MYLVLRDHLHKLGHEIIKMSSFIKTTVLIIYTLKENTNMGKTMGGRMGKEEGKILRGLPMPTKPNHGEKYKFCSLLPIP